MSKQWLYAIHTEIQRVGYYFLKGQTAPADKPLVPSKAGCSPPVNPGSLPHGTVIVLAGQGDGLWLPGLANFPVPTPQLPNSAAPPALGELDLGQRLLVGFWVNPWQNHALGKVSRFQLCNSATPQHPPRTWGIAELELKGFVRLQVPNSPTPQRPPALGELRSWALMAGLVVVPGQPDQSLLVKAVRHTEKDLRMSPRKTVPKLADPDILHLGFGDRLLGRLQLGIQKNSHANGSEKWAKPQATFITILRTLKMRGHKPVQVLVDSLKSYVCLEQIQPLPTKFTEGRWRVTEKQTTKDPSDRHRLKWSLGTGSFHGHAYGITGHTRNRGR